MCRLTQRPDRCRTSPQACAPSKAQVGDATVEPDLAKLTAAHNELAQQYPPPHHLTVAAIDATFRLGVQSSQGCAGWSSAKGGGRQLCP